MPIAAHEINSGEVEIGEILHCWMHRVESCLTESERPAFNRVLSQRQLNMSELGKSIRLNLHQWDLFTGSLKTFIPDIVLRFISTAEMSDLGIYGYAIASTSNLKEALELSNNVHFLTSERQTLILEKKGSKAVLYPKLLVPDNYYVNIAEDALAGTWRLLKLLLGSQFDPGKIAANFSYSAPTYVSSYNTVFDQRCFFKQPDTSITFPARWLNYPVISATRARNSILASGIVENILGRESFNRQNTLDIVWRLLISRLNRHIPSLDDAAKELHLSTSQLRQRLYGMDTSYKRIVLGFRMALAFNYLKRTEFNIQEIAFLLDYSEPAAFSRSFKKYSGQSPQFWREGVRN